MINGQLRHRARLVPLRIEVFLFMMTLVDLIYGYVREENFTITSGDPRVRYWPPTAWVSSANSNEVPVESSLLQSWRVQETRHCDWPARPFSGVLEGNTMSTLHVNFAGSAIYVYGLQKPCPASSSDGIRDNPSFSGYFIDKHIQRSFLPSANPIDDILPSDEAVPLWYNTSLDEAEHELAIQIPHGYTYIFDHLVYTRRLSHLDMGVNSSITKRNPTTDPASSDPEITSDNPALRSSGSKKHDVLTFAAAVGCTVGVLSLISLTLAISICKQRRRSRKRDAQTREESRAVNEDRREAHTHLNSQYSVTIEGDRPRSQPSSVIPRIYAQVNNSSHTYVDNIDGLAPEDSPASRTMIGPTPFIPRFFPNQTEVANVGASLSGSINVPSHQGAEPDSDPPPYSPSNEHSVEDVPTSNVPEYSILVRNNDDGANYADIPPPAPPLPPGLPVIPSLPPATID